MSSPSAPSYSHPTHLACNAKKGTDRPKTTTPHHKPKKKPNKNATDRHNTNQQTNERRRREGKMKKKTGAGAMLRGICGARGPDRRRSPRPESREHKGKPKPQTGFGFPQRLRKRERERERERKRANVVDKHTQTNREKKRGQRKPLQTRGRS